MANAASSLVWVTCTYAYCTKCENAKEATY